MIALPPPRETARCVLPPGRDVAGWYDALRAEIAAHLTPAHAAVLARPVPGEHGPGWAADGARARRLADLPPEDREAVLRHLSSVLSDIRRLAESGAAPLVRQVWPALREVPDAGCVHAVDGRPVLVAWGHAGARPGVLARRDDGVAWRAPPRRPWAVWAVAAAAMLALGVLAGVLAPRLAGGLMPAAVACAAPPGQLALLRDQAAEEARGNELRARLAQLAEELGRRQLQCPLPAPAVAAPASPPAPVPTPPPTPAPPPAPVSPRAPRPCGGDDPAAPPPSRRAGQDGPPSSRSPPCPPDARGAGARPASDGSKTARIETTGRRP